ncbi:MAG: Aspartyl/glutamyl-tRNA(Asn/Gln) amidotransferase subunit, partial [Planctomycetota bacterium]
YRYFPDPDLLPVTVKPETVDAVRESLGELPAATRRRLETEHQLSAYDADVILNQGRAFVAYFREVAAVCGDAKQACNWVTQEVLRSCNESGIGIGEFPVSAASLGKLLNGVREGSVPSSRAKEVFATMVRDRSTVAEALVQLGIQAVDRSELETLCRQLLGENPRIVADVKAGKAQAAGALVGQAKRRNPNVNPNDIREICARLIAEMP